MYILDWGGYTVHAMEVPLPCGSWFCGRFVASGLHAHIQTTVVSSLLCRDVVYVPNPTSGCLLDGRPAVQGCDWWIQPSHASDVTMGFGMSPFSSRVTGIEERGCVCLQVGVLFPYSSLVNEPTRVARFSCSDSRYPPGPQGALHNMP
jgi:hypothetical protein